MIALEMPGTLAGWIIMVAAMLTIVSLVVGGIVKTLHWYIKREVKGQVTAQITKAVDSAMKPVTEKLDAVRFNQGEISAALGTVHDLDVTINNGLTLRVESMESKVDDIHRAIVWDGRTDRREITP